MEETIKFLEREKAYAEKIEKDNQVIPKLRELAKERIQEILNDIEYFNKLEYER